MKRRITLLSITLILLLSITGLAADYVNIDIDNQLVGFNDNYGYPFIDSNNRTQVPFRVTMETFGANVGWESETSTAIAEKDGVTVRVPIGKEYIVRNGELIKTDTAALIKNSRTYLPIRAVLEAFGSTVGWNGETRTVMVEKNTVDAYSYNPELTVHFIDVGQADSILIDYNDYEILIDAGNNADGPLVIDYIDDYIDSELDMIVATHPHEDHIGGLDDVIEAFQVSNIIDSGKTHTSQTYQDYYSAATSEPNCNFLFDNNLSFTLEGDNDFLFRIMECGDDYSDINENSIVSLLEYGNSSILFTGDLTSTVENQYCGLFSDVDILKVGHHGSYASSSVNFLNVVQPEFAVISAGINNSYGHPHQETFDRLIAAGAECIGTFEVGTIVVSMDKNSYHLSTSNVLTADDCNFISTEPATDPEPVPDAPVDPPVSDDIDPIVYITETGSKYHNAGCRYLSSSCIPIKLSDAISRGYTPCKVCH